VGRLKRRERETQNQLPDKEDVKSLEGLVEKKGRASTTKRKERGAQKRRRFEETGGGTEEPGTGTNAFS